MTPVAGFVLRPAAADDRAPLEALVAAAGLPLAGLDDQFPRAFVVAVAADGTLLGAAGLEVYGADGLLRSLVVRPGTRGRGLGAALVDDRLQAARQREVRRVFLLTTDAAEYFRARGFSAVARGAAGPALRASPEFTSACPASAACLACGVEPA